jgi:hypothetical protein
MGKKEGYTLCKGPGISGEFFVRFQEIAARKISTNW